MHKSSDPQVPEISENEAQKKPEPLLQIQCQNRHMNHDFAGMLQLRGNSCQGIAPLANAKAPFNVTTLALFQPFKMKLLLANGGVLCGLAEPGAIEMDAVFLTVSEVISRAEYGVCEHSFGIVAVGFAVGLHRLLERMAFIERIPTEIFDSQKTADVTHLNLGAEFDRRVLLSPDDGTHPGLAETDDAVIDPGTARLIHFTLLGIQRADNG
jgi:hypothetical protein